MKKIRSAMIQRRLLSWYGKNGRVLPWRGETDPYKILVSEVMLQQTQVDRVIPFYERFLKRFPTAKKLAAAGAADVIRLWGGLGYNRRALFLQKTAQAVVARGGWPKDIETLQKLPGIGPYTSRALAVFSFGATVSVLDVNVRRWVERLCFGPEQKRGKTDEVLQTAADLLVPHNRAYDWNQAVMDFGASICTAKRPKCVVCPFASICPSKPFFTSNSISQPSRKPKTVPFKDSNRFVRGRIVDLLRKKKRLRLDALVQAITAEHSHIPLPRLTSALAGLARDGLVEVSRGSVSLPG